MDVINSVLRFLNLAPTPETLSTSNDIAHRSSPPRPAASPLAQGSQRSTSLFFPRLLRSDLTHVHPHPPASPALSASIARLLLLRGLPPELLPRIMDQKDFWNVCRIMSTQRLRVIAGDHSPRDGGSGSVRWANGQEEEMRDEMEKEGSGLKDGDGKVWCLVSGPIGCGQGDVPGLDRDPMDDEAGESGISEELPARRGFLREVVVEIMSKDQGWTSSNSAHYGTYEQSYTWFDVSLLRNGLEVPDSRHTIQHNIHAGQYFKPHSITLDLDHPVVRAARPGDRIVLWARAQYPGWQNNVQEAAITVYTAPNSG